MLGKILGHKYQALNLIEISKKNLIHNYNYLSSINKNIKIAPVLKSNAYGHGLILTAKILDNLNPPFLCVDSLYEAYELAKNGITSPILIMGYIDPKSLDTKKLPFSFAVFSKEQIDAISKYQPLARIHVFVDTGMHREGILLHELNQSLSYIKNKSLEIEGIMSHFGESEKSANPLTKQQINKFEQVSKSINVRWRHISNSGGVMSNYGLGNLARCGIAIYGISPLGNNTKLKPVLRFTTHLAQIKEINKDEFIGYSYTYKTKKTTKIAILPAGYNDGIDRRLSNSGFVKIGNKFTKILGRISMNITTIDVSDFLKAQVGDEVTVISSDPKDKNSIQNLANMANTIPYELLVGLHPSTKRVVI